MEEEYLILYGSGRGLFMYHYSGDIKFTNRYGEEHYQRKGYINLEIMEKMVGITCSNIEVSTSCETCKILPLCGRRMRDAADDKDLCCKYINVTKTIKSIKSAKQSEKSPFKTWCYPIRTRTCQEGQNKR